MNNTFHVKWSDSLLSLSSEGLKRLYRNGKMVKILFILHCATQKIRTDKIQQIIKIELEIDGEIFSNNGTYISCTFRVLFDLYFYHESVFLPYTQVALENQLNVL